LWLRLPQEPGSIDIVAELFTSATPGPEAHDRLMMTIDVEPRSSIANALVKLGRLVDRDEAYREAWWRLRKAEQAARQADPATALTRLLDAAEKLGRIGTAEALSIRHAVAVAIGAVALEVSQ
jgi:hypothetical protein